MKPGQQFWRATYYYYWDNPTAATATTGPLGSYCWNNNLGSGTTVRAMADLKVPAETGMWSDCQKRLTILKENNYYRTSAPHNAGGNMAYADGHVKWQNSNYLRAGWTPATGAAWDVL